MEFNSFKRESPTINLSALIDIVFILVIFIVIAANFQRIKDVQVNLPEADATGAADESALVVTVPESGDIRINSQAVADDQVKATLTQLRTEFKTVMLVADKDVALQRAVKVLTEARAAGFEAVSIATKPIASP